MIDMTNGPVSFRIEVKREARNETLACGHVRCIHVCSGFLKMVGTKYEPRIGSPSRSHLHPRGTTRKCVRCKVTQLGLNHQYIETRSIDQILPEVITLTMR
jgi:hypothetical protein